MSFCEWACLETGQWHCVKGIERGCVLLHVPDRHSDSEMESLCVSSLCVCVVFVCVVFVWCVCDVCGVCVCERENIHIYMCYVLDCCPFRWRGKADLPPGRLAPWIGWR